MLGAGMTTSRYEDSILRSIRRISRAIDIHSRRLAKQYALTGPQLVCLREIIRQEVATPSGIARAVSLSQGTVTGILDRLERRGLIERVRSQRDKRRIHVSVTDAGRELVAQAPSPMHEEFSARLGGLHDGEQAMIDWVLQRVVGLMEAERVDAAPMLMTGRADQAPEDVADFLEATSESTDTKDLPGGRR
jgi:DNA-binding MarR family transcriptional regulator